MWCTPSLLPLRLRRKRCSLRLITTIRGIARVVLVSLFYKSSVYLERTEVGNVMYFKRFPLRIVVRMWHTAAAAANQSLSSLVRLAFYP